MAIIDTNILIWSMLLPGEAPAWVEKAVTGRKDLHFSIVNLIEISIKQSTGKLTRRFTAKQLHDDMVLLGAKFLNITPRTSEILATLPMHHRDPFDRLLIAQAIEHNAPLISTDKIFKSYNIRLIQG